MTSATVNAMQVEAMQDVHSFRKFLAKLKQRVVPQVKEIAHLLPERPPTSESRLKLWAAQDKDTRLASARRRESSSINHRRRRKRPQSPYRKGASMVHLLSLR